MVGKFNNTSVSNKGGDNKENNNNNGNNSVLRGIPVIEVTSPVYMVKEEDMGCMLFCVDSCTLDFTNVNQTSTFAIYLVRDKELYPSVLIKDDNKQIKMVNNISRLMEARFVTICKGNIYVEIAF